MAMMAVRAVWQLAVVAAALALAASEAEATCSVNRNSETTATCQEAETYSVTCAKAIKDHVKLEFSASLQYLLMGAYFGQDNVNLFGFSEMFYKHSSEERAHGLKFIEYLRMRGHREEDFFTGLKPIMGKASWTDAEEALRDALEMEKTVTAAIKRLIDICEKEDYFSADLLTGDWLDEQLNGQRELAGMINTFSTFRRDYESLADWMYSQQLLGA